MDAVGRKEDPSLPPGYVSLVQLRDRWMRMQEEKNLKGQNDDEEKGSSSGTPNESQSHGSSKGEGDRKMGGGFPQAPPRRRVANSGREKSKEKGKGIAVGGPESGYANVQKTDKKDVQETETASVGARNVVGERIPKVKGRGSHGGFGRNSATLEKEAGEGVLAAERGRNGARRSDGNRSGRKHQSPSTGDCEAAGNARSKVEWGVGCF